MGATPEPKAASILRDFNIVWFDPNVNSSENTKYQSLLKAKFNEAAFVPNSSDVVKVIDASSKPVIFISCGSRYEEVKASVQSKNYVTAIIVFCLNPKKFKHYKTECKKVVDVTNTLENLEKALKNIHCEYVRFLRFYETCSVRTFYSLDDKEMVLKSLRTYNFSIFYTLGMKKVNIAKMLSPEVLNKIAVAAKGDDKIKSDIPLITKILKDLHSSNDMKDIIKSYTMDKFYCMLNTYLRHEMAEGFNLFKEYIFCLKGSMCELGIPVIEKGKRLYRSLNLSAEFIKDYENNKGNIVLLNAFTSTSPDITVATKFAHEDATIFEITLVDIDKVFDKFINDFGLTEKNGVFFPVDIGSQSCYPNEKEVVFPPFYPMKIIDVCEDKINGKLYKKVIVEAPFSVCTGKNKFLEHYCKRARKDMKWNETSLEKFVELIEKKVINKLTIGNFLSYTNAQKKRVQQGSLQFQISQTKP
eukprot:TRINITY_DN585_c0_g2_i1.p1 TRINITY_DN585_c0_g2~~TRINITY_DN585_c0_g2_i1.p1  ORF type:complete len:472 (-),score=47.62 TRINITY_DN585_c0_g2_i1:1533-2948(-)